MSKKIIRILMLSIVAVAILATMGTYFFREKQPLPKQVSINTANQPTLGNKNAKVSIVAFEDLKCGNCMRFNVQLFPKIKKKYIDTGIAKYTMINLAFIPGSINAANAARCVYAQDQKLFFPYVKYIYNHQPPEDQNWTTVPKLLEMASQVKGIDQQKLSACLVKSPYNGFINNNFTIAAKAMGPAVATPTLFVNGRVVKPLTMARFKQLIAASK